MLPPPPKLDSIHFRPRLHKAHIGVQEVADVHEVVLLNEVVSPGFLWG